MGSVYKAARFVWLLPDKPLTSNLGYLTFCHGFASQSEREYGDNHADGFYQSISYEHD
jgi:hypothetical protein